MDISPQLKAIEKERDNLQPTPQVGNTLWWYDRNVTTEPYAAMCTKVEAPGRICVCITKPGSHPIHKEGVLYTAHPLHASNPNNPTTVNKGAFDYIGGAKPPKADFQSHADLLKRREENAYRDMEAFEQAKRNREEKEAAKKALEIANA